jgi:mono/diheme cytochrome c family protein
VTQRARSSFFKGRRRHLAALALVFLPMAARADLPDLRLTEIVTSGVSGAQWVELMNGGPEAVSLNGMRLEAEGTDRALLLGGLEPVSPGGIVVVHWNASGTTAGHDFFTGPVSPLATDHGSVSLSSATAAPDASLTGFAQWGAPDRKGAGAADRLGLWPRDQFLTPAAPGHSLALLPGGSPRSLAGWTEASVPTPGAPNTAPVSAWRGWRLVGAAALPPAATWDTGGDLLDAITVSARGEPLHYRHHDGLWSSAVTLTPATGLPVALAGNGGTLDLVLIDPEGGVWHRRFAAGRWSEPLLLGQGALLPPALAYNPAAKELELVLADPSGALQLSRSAGGAWTPWSPIGAFAAPVPPALAINVLDRPFDLLFTAPDGLLKGAHFAAGSWGRPVSGDGFTLLRPAVAVSGADTVEVVITEPDHKVYYNQLTDGVWDRWRWLGLESDTSPALLASPNEPGLELFVADRDGRLVHLRQLNGVWGRPWPLGAVTGQPAAITAGPDGGLELLLAGADGSLWHNRFRPTSPDLVSLSSQVQTIFDAHCVQCHDSGDPIAGQNLEPDAAYFSLVHAASTEVPRLRRVDPGNPAGSYLLHKISGTQAQVGGKGDRMPIGGRLTDAEIQTIRDWIAQGALNN